MIRRTGLDQQSRHYSQKEMTMREVDLKLKCELEWPCRLNSGHACRLNREGANSDVPCRSKMRSLSRHSQKANISP